MVICNRDNMVFCLGHLLIIVLEILSPHLCWEGRAELPFQAAPCSLLSQHCAELAASRPDSSPGARHIRPARGDCRVQLLLGKFHRRHSLRSLTGSQGWHLPKC